MVREYLHNLDVNGAESPFKGNGKYFLTLIYSAI